ncbi:MAG: signal peptidase II [Bacillota bacterium]|nr:signal peptidase II [Bacillota bacterium]
MLYFLLSLFVFLAEICIKRKIDRDQNLPRRIWRGHLLLRRHENYGLALGQLQERPWIPKLIVSLVMLAFLYLTLPLFFQGHIQPLLGIPLCLLYSGGLSNLLDRFIRGYVLDYFSFPKCRWKRLRRIVFNLADMAIFLGIALLIAYLFLP